MWSGNKIIAEDLTGEDLSDVLELHSDASAWWVLPRDPDYGAVELRHVAHALDLDELAIKDLLADDRRAKFEAIGQARLVITNAVSVDKDHAQILVHPVSMIATDRALICLVEPTPDFQPARLLVQQEERDRAGRHRGGRPSRDRGRDPHLRGRGSVARRLQRRARKCAVRGATAQQA